MQVYSNQSLRETRVSKKPQAVRVHLKGRHSRNISSKKELEATCKEQRELTQLKSQKKEVEVELDIARSQLKKALLEKKDLKEKMEQCLVDDDAAKQSKVEVFAIGILFIRHMNFHSLNCTAYNVVLMVM